MKKLLLYLTFLWSITMNAQTYCLSRSSTGNNGDILKVTLGLWSNTSGCNSLSGSIGTATGIASAYSDWNNTSNLPIMILNQSNSLTVQVSACDSMNIWIYSCKVFFDWNHDGDFLDSLEPYTVFIAKTGASSSSINIVAPNFALNGPTKMRVVLVETTSISSISSCGMYSFGETEDYWVNVANCANKVAYASKKFKGAVGDTAILSGYATDSLYTNYIWFKNGQPLCTSCPNPYIINPVQHADTGEYCIKYYYPNGCVASACTKISINTGGGSAPSCANYKSFTFTKNSSVFVFNATGTVPSPYTASYFWQFSNGSTSTQKNVTLTNFPLGISNWAKLKVCILDSLQNVICCDSSKKDSIKNCNLSCSITKVGDSLIVSASGGVTPRFFNWSNGKSGEKIKLNGSGVYCVTVYDNTGCLTECCYTYTAPSNPCSIYKNFTWTNSGTAYIFNPVSIPAHYSPTYYWNLGNGTTSTMSNPTAVYTSNGSYVVKLIYCLKDSNQNIICCDSVTKTVYRDTCNIKANFGWKASSGGNGTIEFKDSTTPTSTMYTYFWTFGDGTTSTAKNPNHAYATNGTYTVCLKVSKWLNSANQQCKDSICKTVTVANVNPCNRMIPNFIWSNSAGSYIFTNSTNMTNFNLVSINFTTSAGGSYNFNNPSHTFTNNGTYSITMTLVLFDVLSGTTCSKTITKWFYVNTSVCGCLDAYNLYSKTGATVTFTNQSSCVDTNTTYLYTFCNGATSTSPNPTYTFPNSGKYKVVMYVTKTVGSTTCVDSFVRYIEIRKTTACIDTPFVNCWNSSATGINCGTYTYPVCGCDSVTYQNSCYAQNAGVKSYSYYPCPNDTNYIKICGYVYHDLNKNCVKDTGDVGLPQIPIKFNTTPAKYAYTNSQGYYSIYLPKGTYTLTQILANTSFPYNQLCPAGNITVAATTGATTYCGNNFYDTTNTCQDLSVKIFRQANITPGFPSWKSIKFQNKGATVVHNVKIHYRFLTGLTVLSSTSPTYTVSGNVITWTLGTLAPYTTGFKYAKFQTPVTMPLGTTVIDSVWIEPDSGDCNLANNNSTYHDTCVGSWDPNDKAAAQPNAITPEVKDLDYHIRFQNTGTAPAHNVVVEDQIDGQFDFNTLKVNGASHEMVAHTEDNGKIYFEFPNIMLPDSGTDYEASQGFVSYSIRMKDNLAIGSQLKNTAHIFFDFNEPVITNTTVHTITLKSTNAVTQLGKDMNISIYPNPTSNKAMIKIALDKSSKISYTLYDINGKAMMTKSPVKSKSNDFSDEINLENLSNGIYILNISINGESTSVKVVKE